MNIGKTIREERIKRKWTQQQLADMTGLSLHSIINWENGYSGINVSSAEIILNALGLELDVKEIGNG